MTDEPPALLRLGPAVVLQGNALRGVFMLCVIAIRKREREGIKPSASDRKLLAELELATRANQPERPDEVAVKPIPATYLVDTAGAAEILGCSRRHVQRIARSLDGQRSRPGNTWVFDKRIVVAYRDTESAA